MTVPLNKIGARDNNRTKWFSSNLKNKKHPARGHLLSTNCSFDSNKNKHGVCRGTCPFKKASSVTVENLLKLIIVDKIRYVAVQFIKHRKLLDNCVTSFRKG